MEPAMARKMWRTLEPYHAMIYFAPEATAAYEALGVERRDGYFASRAAPMGAVPAEVVVATFYNFNPLVVHAAIPAVWAIADPAQLIQARLAAADAALERGLGDASQDPGMGRAAELARLAAQGCTAPGRPLYAGHASLPWPASPRLVLWHAITLLREFRGDGHIACLLEAGLDGVDALVLHAASGDVPRAALQESRQWDDAAWDASIGRLADRSLVDRTGGFTEAGLALRQHIEDHTDRLALAPWLVLGQEGCDELRRLVRPLSAAIVASGTFGFR
ncbi:MAG: hypothetical protein EXQ71_05080 [Acidimicrobiia bacterium]|nr:hypothetical protein [Acidimicrobiia bacterium]